MAKSKTSSFWLTQEIPIASVLTNYQATVDLGSYIDVGDQQAIAIEEVDYIVQGYDTASEHYNNALPGSVTDNVAMSFQLTDLNPGSTLISAANQSVVSSGTFLFDDTNYIGSQSADMFPDNFGSLSGARLVVNDQLYLNTYALTTYAANHELRLTVRIKCRIVKLSTKDWMAIAIQSTAADN
jgi:hypothetical protein